ncbi:hypothetical protein [Microbacterium lacticum]
MDEYSGSMGSDADVAALVSIVGEVEAAVVLLTAAQVAEVRALAAAGQLAARQAAGSPAAVRAHDMALRSVAAELGGVLRVTDRTVQSRIDEARDLVVLPTDVVDAVDGCSASDAGVGSMVIVVVQPGVVAGGSLLV